MSWIVIFRNVIAPKFPVIGEGFLKATPFFSKKLYGDVLHLNTRNRYNRNRTTYNPHCENSQYNSAMDMIYFCLWSVSKMFTNFKICFSNLRSRQLRKKLFKAIHTHKITLNHLFICVRSLVERPYYIRCCSYSLADCWTTEQEIWFDTSSIYDNVGSLHILIWRSARASMRVK